MSEGNFLKNYYEWEAFSNVYLEDSFVLHIFESINEICFSVEFVLTEDHPCYTKPGNDKQYCYRTGKIIFRNLESYYWMERNEISFVDKSGERDYGNIDSFVLSNEGYRLSGDWGELIVRSPSVQLVWD